MKIKIFKGQEEIKGLHVSDFHTGCTSAILPPNAKRMIDGLHSDNVPQDFIQKKLWKMYNEDLTKIGEVDFIANYGDNIEGQQPKTSGRFVLDMDVNNQVEWAVSINQKAIDICKPKVFLGVVGTDYHVGVFNQGDLNVYKKLEQLNPNVKFIFGEILNIEIGDLSWNIAHPVPTADNLASSFDKMIKLQAFEEHIGNSEVTKVLGRGHAHISNWLCDRGSYIFTVPCWQPDSRFGRSKAYLTIKKPDVGVLFTKQFGEIIGPQFFPHPEIYQMIQ